MKSLKTVQTVCKIAHSLSTAAYVICIVGFCICIFGFIGLNFGSDVFKLGGVTLHGLFSDSSGYDVKSLAAMLSGWLLVCIGCGIIAKFSQAYFKNELAAGTPFTLSGSKELLRLGILTAVIPTASAILQKITEGVAAGLMNAPKNAAFDVNFDTAAGVIVGVMFIFISLLCRYGAELESRNGTLDNQA